MTVYLIVSKETDAVMTTRVFASEALARTAVEKLASWIAGVEEIWQHFAVISVEVEGASVMATLLTEAPRLLQLVRRSFENGDYGHVPGLTAEVRDLLNRIDVTPSDPPTFPAQYGLGSE
jgi:hypothetical protein